MRESVEPVRRKPRRPAIASVEVQILTFPGTPEEGAEEEQAADIDPADVADFIDSAHIVVIVDGDILADHQARQGKRHHGAVQ